MSTAAFLDRLPPEVTQNIAERLKGDHAGLEAFRALRLTCRELYLKTFRVFGIDYFSNISVAFNAASLRRLQELAGHENSHGLSLTSFPKSLTCSTYRLLTGDAVWKSFITTSGPNTSMEMSDAAKLITQACQRGPCSPAKRPIGFPYGLAHVNSLARQYMNSVDQQESMEATGLDVKLLAEALAAFPNIKTIRCWGDRHAWGQEDWEKPAGIKIESFLYMQSLISDETNLTIAARKLFAAIAQATMLRKSQGGQLIIEQLQLEGKMDSKGKALDCEPCPRNLQMHKLDISDTLEPFREALSHLKRLDVSVHKISKHVPGEPDVDRELQDGKVALEVLTSNPAFEELSLFLIDDYPRDVAGFVTTHGAFIRSALVTKKFANLRSFRLLAPALWRALPALSHFVHAQAPTLAKLHIVSYRVRGHADVSANREAWRPVLRAAAACPRLAEIFFVVSKTSAVIRGDSDIEIFAKGEEKVAASLAKLVWGPTVPGKELGWIM